MVLYFIPLSYLIRYLPYLFISPHSSPRHEWSLHATFILSAYSPGGRYTIAFPAAVLSFLLVSPLPSPTTFLTVISIHLPAISCTIQTLLAYALG
ncbi:hypothetical protein L226DRAFT_160840 [Lentinus tigrinus ALCF2SS1-7]|uniref:uncharacterized protein n=1 Tax=Lentinus tigrinus ALCF2SS1-7 TaxID=1328758 RepID=UPI001165F6DA|nr:hypothetical protein L226DRAFT_160840 [Lentinus tigrinus ALCF2SS1-7]